MPRIFSRIISATISLESGFTPWSAKTPRMPNSSPRPHAASKRSRRTSSLAVTPRMSVVSAGTPPRDSLAASRYPSRSSLSRFSVSAGAGPLRAGMEKFAVRWKTVSWLACSAISGMDWMPDEPVPMTATRLPVKSTPWWGQRLVK